MSRRIAAFAAILIALVTAVNSDAQGNSFVGSWRGVVTVNGMAVTFNLVMGANQSYSLQEVSRIGMTLQTGYYRVNGQQIGFEVVDWQPKTAPVYHAPGWQGGYYVQQPLAKPPGGMFRFQFTSSSSLTMQDVNLGGVITYNRLQ